MRESTGSLCEGVCSGVPVIREAGPWPLRESFMTKSVHDAHVYVISLAPYHIRHVPEQGAGSWQLRAHQAEQNGQNDMSVCGSSGQAEAAVISRRQGEDC